MLLCGSEPVENGRLCFAVLSRVVIAVLEGVLKIQEKETPEAK